MPTPTNSVLSREVGDEARISQLIYDNESLKIEVEMLREQLKQTGALKIEELRAANEALRIENSQVRVQLEEKTAQLTTLQTSDMRFSNIDDSLKQLLDQIMAQREELTELKLVGKEKDDHIIELKARLSMAEAGAVETVNKTQAQRDGLLVDVERLEKEKAVLAEQLQAAIAGREDDSKRAAELAARLARGNARLAECEAELLSLKESAAALSAVRGDRVSRQEAAMAELTARDAASQKTIMCLQAEVAALHAQVDAAREEQAQLKDVHERALAQATAAPSNNNNNNNSNGTTSSGSIDLYSLEVKAYVAKRVQEAIEDCDRRLQEQVDENASLLSRMALIQQETEQMVKKAGLTGRDVNAMNDRVDAVTKARDARSTMERRVADFLSSETFSKEDVQLLLQDMLDYQERTEEDISTRLLIKDMQAEEAEKTFRWNLKRFENENASLLKQLQRAAFESVKRHQRAASTEADAGHATVLAAAAAASAAPAPTNPTTDTNRTEQQQQHQQQQRSSFSLNEEATPMRSIQPQLYRPQQQQPQPQPAWSPQPSQPPSQQEPPQPLPPLHHHQDPSQYGLDNGRPQTLTAVQPNATAAPVGSGAPIALRPIDSPARSAAAAVAANPPNLQPIPERERNLIVPCPACTYEQAYGNARCEICETPLVLRRR